MHTLGDRRKCNPYEINGYIVISNAWHYLTLNKCREIKNEDMRMDGVIHKNYLLVTRWVSKPKMKG